MGRMFEKKHGSSRQNTTKSKGMRLGWLRMSDYKPVLLKNLSSHSEKLSTYISGPFSTNKIVP